VLFDAHVSRETALRGSALSNASVIAAPLRFCLALFT
jgi:hypothetical protein